jgi:sec-independent protein translocase protein TatA
MGLGAPEIILIVLALLLLFGGKKIPELMRGMGKGVREFKDAQNGVDKTEDKPEENTKVS